MHHLRENGLFRWLICTVIFSIKLRRLIRWAFIPPLFHSAAPLTYPIIEMIWINEQTGRTISKTYLSGRCKWSVCGWIDFRMVYLINNIFKTERSKQKKTNSSNTSHLRTENSAQIAAWLAQQIYYLARKSDYKLPNSTLLIIEFGSFLFVVVGCLKSASQTAKVFGLAVRTNRNTISLTQTNSVSLCIICSLWNH